MPKPSADFVGLVGGYHHNLGPQALGPAICLGDTNCDETGANADIDGDGVVDFGDINPFVDRLVENPLPILCE